jgi:hypothetical protein
MLVPFNEKQMYGTKLKEGVKIITNKQANI